MEPATLWIERRARKVQTCDKRQTVGALVKYTGESKGGDYTSFRFKTLTNSLCAFYGRMSCRTRSSIPANCGVRVEFPPLQCLAAVYQGLVVSPFQYRRWMTGSDIQPAECFAGFCNMRFRCSPRERGWHRTCAREVPKRDAVQRGVFPFRSWLPAGTLRRVFESRATGYLSNRREHVESEQS
jgi:hypothetical protein